MPIQLTLPMEVLKTDLSPEYLEIVKQNWKITFSRQLLTSVTVRRVMGLIASQIKEDGEVKEYYQITADKVIKETNLNKAEVYKRMKGVVYELSTVCYFIEDEETGTVIPRHLLDTTRFKYPAGYYDGKLTVAFNPQLKGIVDQLAHYSRFELGAYMNYSSWYSMRLYELLYAFKDKDFIEFDIDKYREWMGCGIEWDREGKPKYNKKTGKPKYMKYASHTHAITYTTAEPLKDFQGSELEFKVSPVYAESGGRGRPPVVKVCFEFLNKTMLAGERVKLWCGNSEKFREHYKRLKEWKITDENIVKYAKVLGEKGINKLFYHFTEKNKSTKPIAEREKYCNWYINFVGEKIINEN
jgi:hypothetical protein